MKINIEIDCTPGEAREFFGVPDMSPVHEQMQARMAEYMKSMDPEELMKTWMPGGIEAMTRMQEAFFEQMSQFAGSGRAGDKGQKGSS